MPPFRDTAGLGTLPKAPTLRPAKLNPNGPLQGKLFTLVGFNQRDKYRIITALQGRGAKTVTYSRNLLSIKGHVILLPGTAYLCNFDYSDLDGTGPPPLIAEILARIGFVDVGDGSDLRWPRCQDGAMVMTEQHVWRLLELGQWFPCVTVGKFKPSNPLINDPSFRPTPKPTGPPPAFFVMPKWRIPDFVRSPRPARPLNVDAAQAEEIRRTALDTQRAMVGLRRRREADSDSDEYDGNVLSSLPTAAQAAETTSSRPRLSNAQTALATTGPSAVGSTSSNTPKPPATMITIARSAA